MVTVYLSESCVCKHKGLCASNKYTVFLKERFYCQRVMRNLLGNEQGHDEQKGHQNEEDSKQDLKRQVSIHTVVMVIWAAAMCNFCLYIIISV